MELVDSTFLPYVIPLCSRVMDFLSVSGVLLRLLLMELLTVRLMTVLLVTASLSLKWWRGEDGASSSFHG